MPEPHLCNLNKLNFQLALPIPGLAMSAAAIQTHGASGAWEALLAWSCGLKADSQFFVVASSATDNTQMGNTPALLLSLQSVLQQNEQAQSNVAYHHNAWQSEVHWLSYTIHVRLCLLRGEPVLLFSWCHSPSPWFMALLCSQA